MRQCLLLRLTYGKTGSERQGKLPSSLSYQAGDLSPLNPRSGAQYSPSLLGLWEGESMPYICISLFL